MENLDTEKVNSRLGQIKEGAVKNSIPDEGAIYKIGSEYYIVDYLDGSDVHLISTIGKQRLLKTA